MVKRMKKTNKQEGEIMDNEYKDKINDEWKMYRDTVTKAPAYRQCLCPLLEENKSKVERSGWMKENANVGGGEANVNKDEQAIPWKRNSNDD